MISKIVTFVETVAKDKLLHAFAGYIIADIVFAITARFIDTWWINRLISIGILLLAGIGKEIYDTKVKHIKFDWKDVLATVMGGILKQIIFIIQ